MEYFEKIESLKEEIVNTVQNEVVYKDHRMSVDMEDLCCNFDYPDTLLMYRYIRQSMCGAVEEETKDMFYDALYRAAEPYAERVIKNIIDDAEDAKGAYLYQQKEGDK